MLINYNQRDSETQSKEDNSNDKEEICYICYDKIEKTKDISILKCGHKFHYKCIISTYKSQNLRRTCPYCRADGGFLLLKPGMIPMNCIHKEYKDYIEGKLDVVKLIPNKCKYILKKGQNNGFQCSYNDKIHGYCNRHFKIINKKNIQDNNVEVI